jgi:hypothetical protein
MDGRKEGERDGGKKGGEKEGSVELAAMSSLIKLFDAEDGTPGSN